MLSERLSFRRYYRFISGWMDDQKLTNDVRKTINLTTIIASLVIILHDYKYQSGTFRKYLKMSSQWIFRQGKN